MATWWPQRQPRAVVLDVRYDPNSCVRDPAPLRCLSLPLSQSLSMEETLRAILTTQATQSVVTELCRVSGRQERRPRDVLNKQTPDDDVETYIALFERTAVREKWPRTEWANNLMPFLSGEAQGQGQGCHPFSMDLAFPLGPSVCMTGVPCCPSPGTGNDTGPLYQELAGRSCRATYSGPRLTGACGDCQTTPRAMSPSRGLRM